MGVEYLCHVWASAATKISIVFELCCDMLLRKQFYTQPIYTEAISGAVLHEQIKDRSSAAIRISTAVFC